MPPNLAFGPRSISDLIPKREDIPADFWYSRTKWNKIVSDWFFCGLEEVKFFPKDGIDAEMAFQHLRAVISSWSIKHEDKEAFAAYLMSLWFDDITYIPKKRGI